MATVLEKLKARICRKPKVTHTLSARVIRANGSVEDLGVISQTESEGWSVRADG
jgi:hypothetical protein